MRWRWSFVLLLHATALCAQPPLLEYADGRLTARIDQVPLADVLDALAEATGARIRGDVLEPRVVTKRFDDLAIERAVDRLLGRQNFTLRYAADGSLASIDLRGLPAAPSGATRVARVRPPDLHRRVQLSPSLARALGRTHVPITGLIDAAARQSNVAVRAEAVRLLATTIEADRDLRGAIVALSDTALAALLRAKAGARATEIAAGLMGAARSMELRAKASRALRELRRQPAAARVG